MEEKVDSLEIIAEVLIEAYDKEDPDTVWTIVQELRARLDKPDFCSDITDPDEDLDLIGSDEEEEEDDSYSVE